MKESQTTVVKYRTEQDIQLGSAVPRTSGLAEPNCKDDKTLL